MKQPQRTTPARPIDAHPIEDDADAPVHGAPAKADWMYTFADLVSLLLTFFVMLFAMSSLQDDRFREVANSQPSASVDMPSVLIPRAVDLDYLRRIIGAKLAQLPAPEKINDLELVHANGRVTLSLPADTLFAPGSAALLPAGRRSLILLGESLSVFANRITVEGHTDPVRIETDRYPSNWELSIDRAATVARVLRQSGYTRTIATYGHGSSRFDDVDIRLPRDQRYARSRRVDVVIDEPEAEGFGS
jgi:chemotaxis protein MotB